MSHSGSLSADESARWRWGLFPVLIGVGALLIAFIVVVSGWRSQLGLAALGVIASPIAAITGAYFGVQQSTQAAKDVQEGAKAARADVDQAHEQALAAQAEQTRIISELAQVLADLEPDVAARLSERLGLRRP